MAPVRKRTALRTRAERSARDPRGIYAPPSFSTSTTEEASEAAQPFHPSAETVSTTNPFGFDNDDFRLSKKDKRTVKHNALLAKVRDAGVQKKTKRRRPTKKLKADLGGLSDALPEVEAEDGGEDDGWEGISEDGDGAESGAMEVDGMRRAKRRRRKQPVGGASGIIKMTSLKHKPGAMKKKHQMEQGEMDRFRRNLAQMVGSLPPAGVGATDTKIGKATQESDTSQQDKWAALRRFIGGTMEKDKAFAAT